MLKLERCTSVVPSTKTTLPSVSFVEGHIDRFQSLRDPLCLTLCLCPPVGAAGLRDMRRKAEEEKKNEAQLATAMKSIEQTAAAQYARDQAAEAEHRTSTLGEWVGCISVVPRV